jgi:hypothetical protein
MRPAPRPPRVVCRERAPALIDLGAVRRVILRLEGLDPISENELRERARADFAVPIEYISAGTASHGFDAVLVGLAVQLIGTIISATGLYFQLRDRRDDNNPAKVDPAEWAREAVREAERRDLVALDAETRMALEDFLVAADGRKQHRTTIDSSEFSLTLDRDGELLSIEARSSAVRWSRN